MLLQKNVWIPILIVLLAVVGIGLFYGQHIAKQSVSDQEPIKIYKAVEVETPAAAPKPPPPGETAESGHWHGDEWHADPHETHQLPAPVAPLPVPEDVPGVSAPLVQIPDGITDPDVLAAWQRLDYIAKNPFDWGGRASDRALELMDALTPMWVSDDPHDHGEELMIMLDMLAEERDPRSAALLLMYQLDSGVSGRPVKDALVAMAPASVPALIARLNPEDAAEAPLSTIIKLLPPIVEQHRSELGGIVDYILIPRLEVIAAGPGYIGNISRARKALALLKK